MKRIKGMTEIKVSVEDINHLNMLIDRDEAKPAISMGEDNDRTCRCPVCKTVMLRRDKFCSMCGQRIDTENYAL